VNVSRVSVPYNRSAQSYRRNLQLFLCAVALVLGASIGWSQSVPDANRLPDSLSGIGNPVLLATDGFTSANSMPAGPVVRWDKLYDRHGSPLPSGPQDSVGADSLYFKRYGVLDTVYGCPKSQVPDPTPGACRTSLALLDSGTIVGMPPSGAYFYEVKDTVLRRHGTKTGAHTDYTIANGSTCCMTDGQYLYVPVGDTVFKYTLSGTLVTQTALDITPLQNRFSLASDTVWCSADTHTVLNGYACSHFTGGTITPDATWDSGPGTGSGVSIAWDGTYYYAGWNGDSANTFKRFNPDRSLSASGTIDIDPRGVMCKVTASPLMIVISNDSSNHVTALADTLRVASGGILRSIGIYSIDYARLPATEWYNAGCRVIFIYMGPGLPNDRDGLGDSLAKFVDLGGRVVTAMWTDGPWSMGGRFLDEYMPFRMRTQPFTGGSMSTVHDPLHPIMDGVTGGISIMNYMTGNTHHTLRSSNCVCLAEWDIDEHCVVAYLDSADVRLASVGFVPVPYYSQPAGDWARLLVNTILWVWPGTPLVDVSKPDTSSVWHVGTSHNITWTADSGPILRDSIVYSYDDGWSWNFLDKYTGSRNSYKWDSIPNVASRDCYVKVFAWNATGSARGVSGKFTIWPGRDVGVVSIIQPQDTVDSGVTVVPTATVRNYGESQETFPVRFSIGGSYTQDTSMTLAAGATDTISYLGWLANQVGTHPVRCSTQLDADEYVANDRAQDTIVVKSLGGIAQPENNALPLAFVLYRPYPNPLASGAAVRYALPRPAWVDLRIYDVAGTLVRRLVEGVQPPGYRRAHWNGCDDRGRRVAPGVYYCRFRTDDFCAVQKLVVRR
jgi:hypothetical protein